ncbi:hypothetical protein C7457_0509 [Thermovibrio guaymasensis]|uniref:Uncharacterized protein n=1 Tax=Thermovibrio guaymasensis TaxID=240167 RepID=A0A420W8N9_9BACT|nr:hypothetical protein [Thermovibrio guaymasensis]RKQ63635.1 hypothetical protein C7457_0509 [Thermovibrio guaymasensis]
MSCLNFGKEDEEFPFEEEALRFFKGKLPSWDTLDFRVPIWRERFRDRLLSFKNALLGSEEETLIDYLMGLLEREEVSSNRLRVWVYLFENHLFPLLERLVFYRANEPLGLDELSFKLKEIGELPGYGRVETVSDAINRIIALLNCGGEDD